MDPDMVLAALRGGDGDGDGDEPPSGHKFTMRRGPKKGGGGAEATRGALSFNGECLGAADVFGVGRKGLSVFGASQWGDGAAAGHVVRGMARSFHRAGDACFPTGALPLRAGKTVIPSYTKTVLLMTPLAL